MTTIMQSNAVMRLDMHKPRAHNPRGQECTTCRVQPASSTANRSAELGSSPSGTLADVMAHMSGNVDRQRSSSARRLILLAYEHVDANLLGNCRPTK